MTRYAFYLDTNSCSGCKACQVACKDKHSLEAGILWRRVYEIAGGGWRRVGDAWESTVFAYNLSLACNHCAKPICVEVCPTQAISQREDGIVLINEKICTGCRYCSWACPYGAPQYNTAAGKMTKCTFCVDNLDAGLPPACVAACPMRALDFGDRADLEIKYGKAAAFYPLPAAGLTDPSLVLTPPNDAFKAQSEPACIVNWEEVRKP